MNRLLLDVLRADGSAQVDGVLTAECDGADLSLAEKVNRRVLENLMLIQLAHAGRPVENL